MTKQIPFTKRALELLEKPEKRYKVPDIGHKSSVKGLFIDVLVSGKTIFRFRRKHLGRAVTISLGDFPTITIENARKLALKHAATMSQGLNPNEVKREKKQLADRELALSMTVQQLFDVYEVEFQLKIKTNERRPKSLRDIQSLWKAHLQSRVAHLQVGELSRLDANNLLKKILISKTVPIRNKCLSLMKSMYNEQEPNPFAKIKKLAGVKRERVLSKLEVKNLLEALNYEDQIYQDVIKLLLLTGQRKSCVFAMEWREVDHERGVWIIPTSKMKAKRPHAVPLTIEVMDILKRRSSEAVQGEKYVFPASRTATGHITEKSGKGGFWWRITERAGLRSEEKELNVTIHDLRRTIASWSVMRGGNIQMTSKLLGHSDISITASTYAHLDIEQVRAELGITTAELMGLNVVESKVDKLVKEIQQLSGEERRELMIIIGTLN
ncbi:site-specific integrase [Shewanella sp. D64]|uniref:tyrosine-type recombinase/integrase n=1 Tax=unclassified Shewanella TaxID=196818 RepID=UPI0022BA3043|nr:MULTISPECIES: site-specific integrase [unclassified Shewanella]MEC4726552.1 site-specific integrase [Shewanella sp. D64]MEC4737407.1 site-specific integrase [Shewanella sp. E94]WBJ97226.1 site-specific integrase [Shewanella sp. MTB7]